MVTFLLDDPPPYKDGIRINSPHYLCKLIENKKNATYTLVVSQYEKNNTIHYTLRVFATCEFSLTKIVDPYKKQYEKRVCPFINGLLSVPRGFLCPHFKGGRLDLSLSFRSSIEKKL